MKSLSAVVIVVAATMLLAGCIYPPAPTPMPTAAPSGAGANMANPASVHCEQNGGTLEIKTDNAGAQTGICHFPDGSTCDEWAYYRGECAPGEAPAQDASATQPPAAKLSETQARTIATSASACTQVGQLKASSGTYNPNSKTWWFDLAGDKPGCSPACVVSEDGSAEVNWRCTGAIPPTATP
jgi:putative hemolysin